MPGKRSWLALGCGAYLAFVLLGLPAATAYRWLAPGSVLLSGISGTLWSGRAALASVGGLPMRDLEWDLAASSLLLGRLSADFSVRFADGFASATVAVTPRTVSFADLQLTTSLATLAALVPLRGAQGLVSMNLAVLELSNGWPTAAVGTVRVRELSVPPLVPTSDVSLVALGDYELSNFDMLERRLAAQLRDTGGPLEITGTVGLLAPAPGTFRGAMPQFDGRVRERADLPPILREPLEFLTVEVDSDGWRTLDLDPWLQSL